MSFGPFTCIAGPNSAGKSNLFDAITFLSSLASRSLLEAALSVRSEGPGSDVRSIFHRVGTKTVDEMSFEAEMLIPGSAVDDLGQAARATATFLTYKLVLYLDGHNLAISHEALDYINQSDARGHLHFPHNPRWRKSVVHNRRTSPLISTDASQGHVLLHQDLGAGYKGGGRPRPHDVKRLPKTVLQGVNAAEHATAVVARREMQSWKLLQLEPSALRAPDRFTSPTAIATNGAHLPATLSRLANVKVHTALGSSPPDGQEASAALYARIANRLAQLTEGVRSIRVDTDSRRELLTIIVTDVVGTEYEARALSDGTLRFLALTILENDPEAVGVLCLEEPENGIHPLRIPAMLQLLQDLAVDPEEPVGESNPLRQVIVNTHSPAVAAQVPEDSLLLVAPEPMRSNGRLGQQPVFRWLPRTWRHQNESSAILLGDLISYLSPLEPESYRQLEVSPAHRGGARRTIRRVMDRSDVQSWLPFAGAAPNK